MAEEIGSAPQTYGNAPGWSEREGLNAAGPGAPGASPTPPDAPADSSPVEETVPVQVQEPEETPSTPSQPVPEPKKWNQPPQERWEELRTQRAEAERRAQQAEQLAQLALQKLQTPTTPSVPQPDPWEGLVNHPDPATAQFYQQQQRLFQHEAMKVASQQGQATLQAVDAGRRELAAMKIATFRRDNPDIKPGSPEEGAMAGFVSQGMDLDMAKKLATYDRLEAENRAFKSKQSSVGAKRSAANSDASSGIPATAGLPGKVSSSEDRAGEVHDKGGSWREVAGSFFGIK